VDRLACVDVPALPLQLLLRKHPDWGNFPVAVVAEDRPQSLLLWVNTRARRVGIRPGQRYAAALALASDLRAATISETEVREAVLALVEHLRSYSPNVEADIHEPGVFWLQADGLTQLYPSLESWAEKIRLGLRSMQLFGVAAVGFSRFGTYAVAKTNRRSVIFQSLAEEKAVAWRVSIDCIGLAPPVCAALAQLGVRTLGEFLQLPASDILERFGPQAERLHRLASGDRFAPLAPAPLVQAFECQAEVDEPIADAHQLLFFTKTLLDALLEKMAAHGKAIALLEFRFVLDHAPARIESLRPATPTLDAAQLLDLVRLRLENLDLGSGVLQVHLSAQDVPAVATQLALFAQRRRDPEAANRALARVRARLGDAAVLRAEILNAHLPEAQFRWVPLAAVKTPAPQRASVRSLVRRMYTRPVLLPPRPRHEPDGWLLKGFGCGRVVRLLGPYLLSGGWWGGGVHRDYYFAEMQHGERFWVYYDAKRRRWFSQGCVQ
jgi:protein ImuB